MSRTHEVGYVTRMHDLLRQPDVAFTFAAVATAPGAARRALRHWFDDHAAAHRRDTGVVGVEDPLRQPLLLAASEMVANVVRHTNHGGVLRVWDPRPEVPLRMEVEDDDPRLPVPDRAGPDEHSDGGRGLMILAAIADDWGAFPTAAGKVVWAEFDRNRPRRPSGAVA